MVDYSTYDETTLRNMLETSSDLDERQQLRSVLRRLKKHSTTAVSFSPNVENMINKSRNYTTSAFPLATHLEEVNHQSASPSSSLLRRRSELVDARYQSGRNMNCSRVAPDESGSNNRQRTPERSSLRVINGWTPSPQMSANGNRSGLLIENAKNPPVESLKRNLEKTLSEPIIKDDIRLAQSRLIIQQMLAPKIAAAVKTEDSEISRTNPSKAQENRRSYVPAVVTVRTNVDSVQPTFTRSLSDVWVAEGELAVLECNVVARHQPMVLWYRNSEPLRPSDGKHVQTYDGDLAQLRIQNVGGEDVGVYECVARNGYGKSSESSYLSLKDDGREPDSKFKRPKFPSVVTVRRSETLPSSILNTRLGNSAARQLHGQRMAAVTPSSRDERLGMLKPAEEVEEEAVARTTRTEKASDGGKVTTTTTVTTHKAKDAGHLVTKQTKQITRVGGVGTTNYSINKCSAEEIAERLAGIFETKAMNGTSGIILVKTENWNSQDGITHRNEKSQIWEAPRLALSFSAADYPNRPNYSEDIGFNPLQRNPTTVKQKLLEWCRITLKNYQHLNITNFSTSWNDGMAFCALVHHFIPDAFDYNQLDPKNRRENFQLAFEMADKRAGIMALLEVEDMVKMTVPDWKSVFMYIQSIYSHFVPPKPETPIQSNPVDSRQ